MWREMVIEAIRKDPAWMNGRYESEPEAAMRAAADLLVLVGTPPLPAQKQWPTREAADGHLDEAVGRYMAEMDANDLLYQIDASRDYDPSARLEKIKAPVMWVNSADDFINPPELGIAEQAVKRIARGRFVLIPLGEETHGHGTHTWAALWKDHLAELLKESQP
jgi:homoserine O-acetyltransferase